MNIVAADSQGHSRIDSAGGLVTISSMTGFARAAASDERFAWTWEARSVNGRSLDMRCRVPPGFDQLESGARAAVAKRFNRGNINLKTSYTKVGQRMLWRSQWHRASGVDV